MRYNNIVLIASEKENFRRFMELISFPVKQLSGYELKEAIWENISLNYLSRAYPGCCSIPRYDWVIIEIRGNITGMSPSFANKNSRCRVNSTSQSTFKSARYNCHDLLLTPWGEPPSQVRRYYSWRRLFRSPKWSRKWKSYVNNTIM